MTASYNRTCRDDYTFSSLK